VRTDGRPSGTVTFVFTDVEDSTRLWETAPAAMRDALARHDEILRTAMQSHGGHVFSTGGDGVAAAFSRAGDAVTAALDAQRGLQREQWPDGAELRVRMGMHTGEAQERDGDYFGPPVNRAARVMGAANGGQVVMTATVADLVEAHPDIELVHLGQHRLRGIDEPVELVGVAGPEVAWPDLPIATVAEADRVHVPVPSTELVGRAAEVADLIDVVDRERLVTLTGTGGVGKTRLATEVARAAADRFPGGVWLVELAPVGDPAMVFSALATALGIRAKQQMSLAEATLDWLGGRRVLLVLDNAEHLLDAVADAISHIRASCPEVSVLVTSRERVGVAGEVVWPVGTLDPGGDGFELFTARARAANSGFTLDAADRARVVAICDRLDGIPLAIELAAARVRSVSVAELLERLDDRFRLLRGGSRGGVDRHQTLQATVSWSYQLLDERERVLFDRLSVFAGSFSLDAAEAVCPDDAVDELDVFEILSDLVDKSMVVADTSGPRTRYRLLETLRQFGEQHLFEAGEVASRRDRHLAFYSARAAELDAVSRSVHPEASYAEFPLEWDNLRAAFRWALELEALDAAQNLVARTWSWASRRVRWEHQEWVEQALALATSLGETAPFLWGCAGSWAYAAGDPTTVHRCGSRLAAEATNDVDELRARWLIVMAEWERGELDACVAALPQLRSALRHTEPAPELALDLLGYTSTLYVMSVVLQPDEAAGDLEAARRLATDIGTPLGRAWLFWLRMFELLARGRPADVVSVGAEAREFVGHHAPGLAGYVAAFQAMALAQLDDNASTRLAFGDVLRDLREQGNWAPLWLSIEALAIHLAGRGSPRQAQVILGYLEAHDVRNGGLSGPRAKAEARVSVLPDGDELAATGAAMTRDEVVDYTLTAIDS
jgi:predicted ATPase/class 3 adenylate cyclase